MLAYEIGDTITIHKDDFAYISHPSITKLDNGEWVAVFNHSCRRAYRAHPPEDPLFRNLLSRTGDQGATWSEPYFVPDFDWHGVECPGIEQLSDGTVILTQFRFSWYPLGLARKRRAAGERVAIKLPEIRGFVEEFGDDDWERSAFPWARGFHGLYAHISSDRGHSFDTTVRIDTAPYFDGYTRTGVTELADGRLAYALEEHPYCQHNFIVFSADGGHTWTFPHLINETHGQIDGEPDLIEPSPGELLCVLRDSSNTGYLHFCRSTDGGFTWSAPERTGMYGHPGHLLRLADGRLLCTYGRRKDPFGIRACLSEDGGRTWLAENEIVIRDDFPDGDLGYPTSLEYEPGRIFTCYYGKQSDGVTCVQGTYFDIA